MNLSIDSWIVADDSSLSVGKPADLQVVLFINDHLVIESQLASV